MLSHRPATCVVGDVYYSYPRIYICIWPNTWTRTE